MPVRCYATAALLGLTYRGAVLHCTKVGPDEYSQLLVKIGFILVLVELLDDPDADLQYNCAAAPSNITADGNGVISSIIPHLDVFTPC